MSDSLPDPALLSDEGRALLAQLLDPATLLHGRCGRRVAEHPHGSIHWPCPFPPVPVREFARAPQPDPRVAAERQLLRAARSVLLAHGHGIGTTCGPLCHQDDRPLCPATLDDDLDPLACHLPAGHHSPDHYDRDRRTAWTTADDRTTPDPLPLPDDGPWLATDESLRYMDTRGGIWAAPAGTAVPEPPQDPPLPAPWRLEVPGA